MITYYDSGRSISSYRGDPGRTTCIYEPAIARYGKGSVSRSPLSDRLFSSGRGELSSPRVTSVTIDENTSNRSLTLALTRSYGLFVEYAPSGPQFFRLDNGSVVKADLSAFVVLDQLKDRKAIQKAFSSLKNPDLRVVCLGLRRCSYRPSVIVEYHELESGGNLLADLASRKLSPVFILCPKNQQNLCELLKRYEKLCFALSFITGEEKPAQTVYLGDEPRIHRDGPFISRFRIDDILVTISLVKIDVPSGSYYQLEVVRDGFSPGYTDRIPDRRKAQSCHASLVDDAKRAGRIILDSKLRPGYLDPSYYEM